MKRKPIVLALAPLLVVGAGLWGVNYRLDHPPLTQADKEFRALVAGSSMTQITYVKSNSSPVKIAQVEILNSKQTSQLIALIHLERMSDSSGVTSSVFKERFEVKFMGREGQPPVRFGLFQTPTQSELHNLDAPYMFYMIDARSTMKLNRTLDAYLPQRIRP